jgi:hypothetical protein
LCKAEQNQLMVASSTTFSRLLDTGRLCSFKNSGRLQHDGAMLSYFAVFFLWTMGMLCEFRLEDLAYSFRYRPVGPDSSNDVHDFGSY